MHNQKFENYDLFGRHTEGLSPGDNLLALSDCSKEVREKPGYMSFCNKKQVIKRLLLIKEKQTFQVNEFSAFSCMGSCQSLGL